MSTGFVAGGRYALRRPAANGEAAPKPGDHRNELATFRSVHLGFVFPPLYPLGSEQICPMKLLQHRKLGPAFGRVLIDGGGAFLIETCGRPLVSNGVDQIGVESSLRADGFMRVPFQIVVGLAAGHQNRKLACARIERSARHCGVVKMQ
jgi:hypothetical protein